MLKISYIKHMNITSLIFLLPIVLIGVGYYYDYKENPKRFNRDIRGGVLYFLVFFALILIERIVFNVGYLYIVLQIAILILISFCAKYFIQKRKDIKKRER